LTTLHATAAYIYLLAPVPQGDNKEEDVPVKTVEDCRKPSSDRAENDQL
jgi:hypothetical protein